MTTHSTIYRLFALLALTLYLAGCAETRAGDDPYQGSETGLESADGEDEGEDAGASSGRGFDEIGDTDTDTGADDQGGEDEDEGEDEGLPPLDVPKDDPAPDCYPAPAPVLDCEMGEQGCECYHTGGCNAGLACSPASGLCDCPQ